MEQESLKCNSRSLNLSNTPFRASMSRGPNSNVRSISLKIKSINPLHSRGYFHSRDIRCRNLKGDSYLLDAILVGKSDSSRRKTTLVG